jgi:hypothetical protein
MEYRDVGHTGQELVLRIYEEVHRARVSLKIALA